MSQVIIIIIITIIIINSSSSMEFTNTGLNWSESDHSILDSDLIRLRIQIFNANYRKIDLIRTNHEISRERDEFRRRIRELEGGLTETATIRDELERDLKISREKIDEMEEETNKNQKFLSKIVESILSMENHLSIQDENISEERLQKLEDFESVLELVKEIEIKVEKLIESTEKKKMEFKRNMEFLEEENRDMNVLLKSALLEKQTAEKRLKETNDQRKSSLMQIAERGLQRIGFGFRESVEETQDLAKDEQEKEENSMVITIEKTMKKLRKEISQLKISLDESRLETEELKKFTEKQAQELEENSINIDELRNRERLLTQNVEELVKLTTEAEEEVIRWREACELEVEAGKREIEEHDQLITILKLEMKKLKSALAISDEKLTRKEELAKAAMVAEEAAEKSLWLAQRRIGELVNRTEQLYQQLGEEEEAFTERKRWKLRSVWCWPLWRLPNTDTTATAAETATAASPSCVNNRVLVRYGA